MRRMKGIYGFFRESADKYPDNTFVQTGDKIWSYNDVGRISGYVSELLLERGVQKGDRVVVFCDNSVQYISAFIGILGCNAVVVPVNPSKMADSILYIIEKCTPEVILTCNSAAPKLDQITSLLRFKIINIDRLNIWPDHRQEGIIDCERGLTANDDDAAEILFTSGTTAEPKGVTLTHGNLIANTEAIIDYLKLTGSDSILMSLPFTYSYGNSILLTHIFAGASIVIENASAFPYKVMEEIKKSKVTGFSTVGSYINLMLKYIKNLDGDEKFLDSLRYITLAGEAANNDDVRYISRNYPDIEVFVMYGQTEAGARLSFLKPEMLQSKLGSIGKGLSNVELKVVNGEGVEIMPGELGEIIARGPNIMKGYWDDPAATEDVIRRGWLYTGDVATVDEDGYIFIKGRRTDMIKHMGHRISPLEIENVINNCSYIKESAVVESILDGVTVIKAYITLNKTCTIEEIQRIVYPGLPLYMRPQVFEVIDQLPRTETGKIRRSGLR